MTNDIPVAPGEFCDARRRGKEILVFDKNGEPLERVPAGHDAEAYVGEWDLRFRGWRARAGR